MTLQFRSPMRALFTGMMGACALAIGLAAIPASAQTKLILQAGNPAPDFGYIDLWVAQKGGFFKEEGLEVEVRHAANASQAAQIVASGGADLTRFTYEPAIIGYDKGIRGKIFYQLYTRLIYFIAVPVDSPYKTIADLKGKRIGVLGMGSTSILVVKSMLHETGMKPDDVTFLPVGKADSAIAALKSNQVDAFAHWDAVYATMEGMGQKLRYIYHPKIADVGNGGYFAPTKTMNDPVKHKALAGFSRAIAKATVFTLENPEAAVKMFWQVAPRNTAIDENVAMKSAVQELAFMSQSWDVRKYVGLKYGAINKPKLQSYVDVLLAGGAITKTVPVDEIATTEFTDFANNFDIEKVRAQARSWK